MYTILFGEKPTEHFVKHHRVDSIVRHSFLICLVHILNLVEAVHVTNVSKVKENMASLSSFLICGGFQLSMVFDLWKL